VITVYEDTPIMQTYLLAFLVSDFHIKSNADTKLPSDVLQRVVGRPSYVSTGQADFALEAGIKILKSFEDHFSYNYPLPKIDQVTILEMFVLNDVEKPIDFRQEFRVSGVQWKIGDLLRKYMLGEIASVHSNAL
jgi:hypothetical protein